MLVRRPVNTLATQTKATITQTASLTRSLWHRASSARIISLQSKTISTLRLQRCLLLRRYHAASSWISRWTNTLCILCAFDSTRITERDVKRAECLFIVTGRNSKECLCSQYLGEHRWYYKVCGRIDSNSTQTRLFFYFRLLRLEWAQRSSHHRLPFSTPICRRESTLWRRLLAASLHFATFEACGGR